MSKALNHNQLAARIQLVEEHVRAENRHDVDAIMATFGQQPTFILNGTTFAGRESIRALYEGFGFGQQGSFSELQAAEQHRYLSEEVIICEVLLRGKHTNPFEGIPATGRVFEIPACAIFTFDEAGQLAGEKVYFDGVLLLKQLGVLS